MSILFAEVGIDVSKDRLDVSVDGKRPFSVENSLAGAEQLVSQLKGACRVHIESSGGYDRLVRRALARAGHEVCIHNPRRVRRLADVRGVSAKTDSLDARHLSTSGHLLRPGFQKSEEHEDLSDISRAIDALKQDLARTKRRMRVPGMGSPCRAAYEQVVKALESQIHELERVFESEVKKSSMSERFQLALSLPCVGPALARIAVCELPGNLDELDRGSVASYAGLAPLDNSSGKFKGASHVGKGNVHLKAGLYMPGMAAIQSQEWAKSLYARLRAKGRSHPQAIVAVMRRLLLRLFCVLKRGTPWQDEPLMA